FAIRTDEPEAFLAELPCNLRRLRSSACLTIQALAGTRLMLLSEKTPPPQPPVSKLHIVERSAASLGSAYSSFLSGLTLLSKNSCSLAQMTLLLSNRLIQRTTLLFETDLLDSGENSKLEHVSARKTWRDALQARRRTLNSRHYVGKRGA